MKIFLISNMYPSSSHLSYGIFVKRFEEALIGSFDYERVVLTKKKGFIPKLLGYTWLYIRILGIYFRSRSKDLVYIHFPLYFSYLILPLCKKGTSVVLNFHGSDALFNTPLKRLLAKGLKKAIEECKLVVVPSEYYKKRLMDLFGLNEDKFFVSPSGGIDGNVFRPVAKEKDVFIFGFISNFIHGKGWSFFLEALSILDKAKGTIPFKAIMLGDGPDREKIKKQINERGLNVEIIGRVEQSALAKVYAKFDVFVFPSVHHAESLGLVGLEALMCGVPVIASKAGGPMGYIEHGKNGYLTEKGDSKDLAEKMILFQNLDKNTVSEMKQNAIRTAQKYEKRKVANRLVKMLNSLKSE